MLGFPRPPATEDAGAGPSGPRLRVLTMAAAAIATPAPIAAHEKWFVESSSYPLELGRAIRDPAAWAALGVAAALWGMVAVLWHVRGRRPLLPGPRELGGNPEAREALYAFIPLILAIHLAVPLLVSALSHGLFTPNVRLSGLWAHFGTLGQIGVALGLVYGTPTRVWALVLASLWAGGLAVAGLEPMLEAIHILGFSAFFFCAGRGPFAVDRALFPHWEPSPRWVAAAVPALRAGVGLGLLVVALTEKLLNRPLALAFLQTHPLNFVAAVGVPLTDEQFVLVAGAVEVFIGLAILTGVFLREVVVLAWLPFNLTLGIFGPEELVGHLPFYGAMALFFLWGTTDADNLRAWQRGILRPSLGALLGGR